MSDNALVMAMRRDDLPAFTEFVLRFQPLLSSRARPLVASRAERDELVTELLDDAATRFTLGRARLPRSLAAYLVTSLQRKVIGAYRERERRERRDERAVDDLEPHSERAVLTACSDYALRSSRGPEWESAAPLPALARLATALDNQVNDGEREILAWVARRIPQWQIAAWLGISEAAAAKRIARLRDRLRDEAGRYAAALSPEEQGELHRFFLRAAGPAPAAEGEGHASPYPDLGADSARRVRRVAERRYSNE